MDQLKRRWGPPKIMNERKIMNYIPKIKYPAIYTGHKKKECKSVSVSAY